MRKRSGCFLVLVALLLVTGTGIGVAQQEITVLAADAFSPESNNPLVAEFYQRISAEFEEQHGISVRWVITTGTMHYRLQEVLARAQDNRMYNVVNPAAVWIPPLVAAEALEPLTDYMSQDFLDDFMEGPRVTHSFQGVSYSLPFYAVSRFLFYRKSMLEEAGVAPPQTWDELIDVGTKLTTPNRFALIAPTQTGNFAWIHLAQMIRGQDVALIGDDDRPLLGESPTREAILRIYQFWHDLRHVHNIVPDLTATLGEADMAPFVVSDQTAMWIAGDSFLENFREFPWILDDVGAVPLPMPDGYNPAIETGGWGWALGRTELTPQNDPELQRKAWEFIEMLLDPRNMAEWINARGINLPTRVSAMDWVDRDSIIYPIEAMDTMANAIDSFARPLPVVPYTAVMQDELSRGLEQIILGNMTPEEALEAAIQEVERAWLRVLEE